MKNLLKNKFAAKTLELHTVSNNSFLFFMPEESIQLPEIKMEGRSGCKLDVLKEGSHVIIKKYSSSIEYNKRLLKQANKQQVFYNNLPENYIFSTARVIETYSSENSLSWFSMPYLFSEKYSNYFEQASIVDLKNVLNHIIDYFNFNINNSVSKKIDERIIASKIEELKLRVAENISTTNKDYFFYALQYLKTNTPDLPLPIGTCHGDFTFSNILFGDNKIYLLDFLDSFVESPMIDIVKIRQDTCFKWSIMLEKEMPSYKKNKLIQTFNYLDSEIALFCNNQLGMSKWYNYLQIFNLLRIVPYLNNSEEIFFIEKSLRQIL
ncbi:MAG: phosphotransferase [Segetibacter sp.]